eukprot:6175920-Pleurochrysis_carterae.AAC.1
MKGGIQGSVNVVLKCGTTAGSRESTRGSWKRTCAERRKHTTEIKKSGRQRKHLRKQESERVPQGERGRAWASVGERGRESESG